jgi:hypothetical protein
LGQNREIDPKVRLTPKCGVTQVHGI